MYSENWMGTSCSIQHYKTKSDYGILRKKPFVKPKALFHVKMGNDAQKKVILINYQK